MKVNAESWSTEYHNGKTCLDHFLVAARVDVVRLSLNCGHLGAYCSSPRSYMSMDSHGGMILTGETEEVGEIPVPVHFSHHRSHKD
jgi:hypothetical protein